MINECERSENTAQHSNKETIKISRTYITRDVSYYQTKSTLEDTTDS